MSALAGPCSPVPRIEGPKPPDAAAWIPVARVAEVLGRDERTWRRRAAELARQGLAVKRRDAATGLITWHIHCAHHPLLLRCAAGGEVPRATPAVDALASATEPQRAGALARAGALIEFRLWRIRPDVDTRRDFAAFRAHLRDTFGLAPSRSQLYAWDASAPRGVGVDTKDIAAALLDRRGGDRRGDNGKITPAAWDYFRSLYLGPGRRTIASCWREVDLAARREGWRWPSLRTITRRAEAEITPSARAYARDGEHAWRKTFLPPIEQAREAWLTGERWDADHSLCDFFVRVPAPDGWKMERPWLTAWIDWRSRRLMGWRISLHPDSDAIRAALIDAVGRPDVSVPRVAWLDNGKDFASAAIGGLTKRERRAAGSKASAPSSAAWAGLLGMLGIEPHFGQPYNPNSKARIERAFGTIHMDFDRRVPSYCGSESVRVDTDHLHEVLADPSNVPTIEEIRVAFGRWVEECYNATAAHSLDDLEDPSTGERLSRAAYYARTVWKRRPLADRRVLGLLALSWARPAKVSKLGVRITVAGETLWYGQHEPRLQDLVGSGRKVLIAYDPENVASAVHVFELSGRFICEAPLNSRHGGPLDGVSKEALRRAHAARRAVRRRVREQVDTSALMLSAAELAASKQREIDLAEGRRRIAAAAAERAAEFPALAAPVFTPLDGEPRRMESAGRAPGPSRACPADVTDDDVLSALADSIAGAQPDDDDDGMDLLAGAGDAVRDREPDDEDELDLIGVATGADEDEAGILEELT